MPAPRITHAEASASTADAQTLRTARAVGEAMLAAPQRPMDRTTSELMLKLIVAADTFSLPTDRDLPLGIQIAQRRAEVFGFPVTDAALLMVGQLCDRPGNIVLYCAVLKTLADRLGRAATISDLCEAFPWGFPDNDALTAIWDRQKARDGNGPDNWLDRAEAWQ